MTLDPKDLETTVAPPEAAGASETSEPKYEVPVLIPLGNVHALLAGGGMTISDGGKNSKRHGP
jgi:hypothetical protein